MITVKDDSPPPAYSAIPSINSTDPSAEQQPASNSHLQPQASNAGPTLHQQQQHRAYGPTPLPRQLEAGVILPYDDPRSEFFQQRAVRRARWRFVSALLWAIGIWAMFGLVTGGIVVDIRQA